MIKFKKVLLIDDDSDTHFLHALVLKEAKFSGEVKTVMNGVEAIDYLVNDCSKANSYPDLIIVDINMPIMNGFEFLEEYKKRKIKGNSEILMLSSSCDFRDKNRAIEVGVKLLNKPLTLAMLTTISRKENNYVRAIGNIAKQLR